MPLLILVLGILIGGYALYRFMLTATIRDIVAMVITIGTLVIGSALFFLAVTGKLPAALGILAALTPIVLSWWNAKERVKVPKGEMSVYDALEILGLKGEPDEEEIENAYKRLMKKVHPDQEGSEGLAKNLNQAKDTLMNHLKK
ncbi:MAG: J domain-containing protein [Pseudomonadota bacterium]